MSQLRDAALTAMAKVRYVRDTWQAGPWEALDLGYRQHCCRNEESPLDALLALLRDQPELAEVMARGIHTGRIAKHEGGWDDLDEWEQGCCRKDTVSALAALRDAFGEGE